AQRTAVRDAVIASGARAGLEIAEPALARLDAYATAWSEARAELCQRQLDHRESGRVVERRVECLDRARIELAARVEVLTAPRPDQVPRMAAIVGTLPALQDCLAAELPNLRGFAPPDPEHRRARRGVVTAIAGVDALIPAGRWDEARTRLDDIAQEHAAILESDPIVAFRYHVAQGRVRSGDERIGHNYEALEAAIEAGGDADVQMAYHELGNRLYDEKRFEEAHRIIGLGQAAVGAFRRRTITTRGRELAAIAEAKFMVMTGDVCREQGRPDEAIAAFSEGLALLRGSKIQDRLAIIHAINNLAEVHRIQGHYDDARTLYEEAIAEAEVHLGPWHPDIATMLDNRAAIAADTGHLQEAVVDLERALRILHATVGPDGEPVGLTRFNLGVITLTYGRIAEAKVHFERAEAVWRGGGMRTAAFVHVAVAALASVAHHEGDDAEALRLHDASVAGLRNLTQGPNPVLAQVIAERGTTLLEMGRTRDAKAQTEEAVAMFEKTMAMRSYGAAAVMMIDAHAALALGRLDDAIRGYQRVQAIFDRLTNPLHPGLASLHAGWAEVARRQGDDAKVGRHEARIDAVVAAHPGLVVWAREGLRGATTDAAKKGERER
ncbi:MAG: tetratricopeptide repeat protein, partial [Myxococcota bacterium]